MDGKKSASTMKFLPVIIALFFGHAAVTSAQDFRMSLLQYQFNLLPLNPGYAARIDSPGFDIVYFGNFTSSSQLSQTALVSAQAPTRHGGLGAVLNLYNSTSYGEFNFRPTYAYQVHLPGGGKISLGLGLGISYADIRTTSFYGNSQNDFMTLDGSWGIYYFKEHFFAGAAVVNAFDLKIMSLGDSGTGGIVRESPISLQVGSIFRLFENIRMKPMALYQYTNLYVMPQKPLTTGATRYSAGELLASFIIDENYVVGVLAGRSVVKGAGSINHFGISATFIFSGFRIGYAFQDYSRKDSGVSLPVSHLITAGYDFWQAEDSTPRFF